MAEMEKHSGNLGSMAKTVDEMLEYAKGNDRTELLQLKSRIDRKQAGKKAKWLIYGGIAAVIAFFVISEELNGRGARNSGVSSTTYKPPSNNQTSTTSNSFASSESQPPVGKGLSLNKPQVRYCVFQGERLDAMRVMVNTDNQIRAFNELIDDFNSRCSNYRYTSGVLSSIRREAQSKTSEFTNDAKRTVGSW
ncbi:hypothetical protein [Roseovarius confluentis]|uniref:hypothetical protein n=1 Tax=Roseovarius confluentis TaxID=1852027 RepID=UPI003BAA9FEC